MRRRTVIVLGAIGVVVAVVTALAWYTRDGGVTPAVASGGAPVATTATSGAPTSVAGEGPAATSSTAPLVPVGVPASPRPEPPPPQAEAIDGFAGVGAVTIAAGGADLYAEIGGSVFVRAREGLVMAAEGSASGGWIRLLTMCDTEAWVHESEVFAEPAVPLRPIGAGFDFGDAVIVVDPGHGGPHNIGAVSPDGNMLEKEVNVDIARRLRDLLETPHTVDWTTGVVYAGDDIPAVRRALVTRVGEGDAADYETGLIFRSRLANAVNADAMVSIHNNAGWELSLEVPGSDVYYQSQIPESRRLAVILSEEFQRSFAPFDADWVGASFVGAKSRLSPRDGTSQYYGVLRRSEMPTVIGEGAYLASQSEADLLATPEFRQAYADAAYRALVRFLTTDDPGSWPSTDPVVWDGSRGSGDARPDCVVPSQ
jgi:N-acetylmuramoyl-L-alanine amidase